MKPRPRKCHACHQWFRPQPHNAYHQHHCTAPLCRKASKRRSQQKWLRKNRDAYKGEGGNSERVRNWRPSHSGYWRNVRRRRQHIRLGLAEVPRKPGGKPEIHLRIENLKTGALRDLWVSKKPVNKPFWAFLGWCVTRFDGCLCPI